MPTGQQAPTVVPAKETAFTITAPPIFQVPAVAEGEHGERESVSKVWPHHSPVSDLEKVSYLFTQKLAVHYVPGARHYTRDTSGCKKCYGRVKAGEHTVEEY